MRDNKFNAVTFALALLALTPIVPACGDADTGATQATLNVADTADSGGQLVSDGGADGAPTGEDAAIQPDAAPDDATSAEDASADVAVTDVAPIDVPPSDVAPADVANVDAGVADAASVSDPACPDCLFTQQPAAPHPGGKGTYPLAAAETIEYGSGFSNNYKRMLVIRPSAPGVFPTVLFVHGKALYEGGGFPGKLGYPYRAFLEQIASHGYVVAFVRVESGLLDGDHLRMADDLLAASKVLFDKVTLANPNQVAYVGHSMGAKVVLLAASKALAQDSKQQYADPAAVFAYAVSNEPPPFGNFQNAMDPVKLIPADAPTWFTLATGNDDDIAPWNDPAKANASALYAALATQKRQLIVVEGTGKDDANAPSSPELVDDHSAPMSIEGKVGGAADFATPVSHLDALDWYGFWKWTVGGLNFHFKGGDAKWAYGEMRSHGGHLANGTVIAHKVEKQGWTTLPAP